MKKILAFLLACLFIGSVCSNSSDVASKSQYDSPCTFKKNADKRLDNTFPFDKATKIEAISFDLDKFEKGLKMQNNPSTAAVEIKDSVLFVPPVIHRYFLNPNQMQKLFETLIFNQDEDSGKMRYYEPNDILVFYRGDKPFAFLELCFHCKHWRNYKTDFKDFCDQKWETLATFFPQRKK